MICLVHSMVPVFGLSIESCIVVQPNPPPLKRKKEKKKTLRRISIVCMDVYVCARVWEHVLYLGIYDCGHNKRSVKLHFGPTRRPLRKKSSGGS